MGKKNQLRNQKRSTKRSFYARQHRSRYLSSKRTVGNKSQINEVRNLVEQKKLEKQLKGSWKFKIKILWFRFKRATQCKIGWHNLKLQAGKIGTPKYLCADCMRGSQLLWEVEDFVNQSNQVKSYGRKEKNPKGGKLGDKQRVPQERREDESS